MAMNRRDFLKVGAGASGSLVVSLALPGCAGIQTGYQPEAGEWRPDAWLELTENDEVFFTLAHDPRIDDMGLLAALQSKAFYIGAMGSRKTSEARRERLSSLGLEDAVLDRLRAPIGVDIPSKTPAEIAISVVADLIVARHHLRAAPPSL
ncbi:XdhC family protein [Marinobacter sp. Arc7-DN-1]|uniref:XdhC family protein n=1 Tax=Marinobacter sp. Arc7-DN-1 TaxID=2304594 RepID=UPI000E441D2D|nr:XdhC family protein [Marinobacter sp. Arc7-DN-1]AXS85044.1 hypothetical protein D0851_19735 [Marinobacter sp. Arc7-DN-1]